MSRLFEGTGDQPMRQTGQGEVLVSAQGVSKKFCRSLKRSLWYGVQDVVSELNPFSGSRRGGDVERELREGEFWAVNDVSFELRRGECLGVLGHNGAGKTTLLKLLNGLITPDAGSIAMRGKIGALIALGAGFNPALTGRENILINSAILGKSRKETEEKIAQVIDFSGLQDFIDAPVQSYSSGMQVRLGFATAVLMIEPDVLILDEVLAVGDAAFRAKCYNEINKLSKKTAIILISHSMTHISRLATQVMVLKRGEKVFHGSPDKGINEYYRSIEEKEQQSTSVLNGPVRVQSITLRNRNTNDKAEIIANTAEELELLISISSNIAIDEIVIDLCFISQSGDFVAESNNYLSGQRLPLSIGQNKCQVSIKSLDLNPGVYSIDCLVMCKNMSEHYDWQKNILKIEVRNNRFASANYQMASIFNMELPSSK